jgi:hypothetical protein
MTAPDDAGHAALERLLARRERLAPPAALRSRTFAAIDAALAAPAIVPVRDDLRIALAACGAMALTLALLVVTLARQSNRSPLARPAGVSLADRAAVAGIAVETARPALVAAIPRRSEPAVGGDGNLRPLDMPRILRGDL